MKRFDKGYIYSSLLSDFFGSCALVFVFLEDLFLDDTASSKDFVSALPLLIAALAVVYLCFIAYRVLYYKKSGYEFTKTEIKCNRGVFFRKKSVLEYKKIHAINKKQNIFHRIFKIAVLTVDSGSTNTSHQAEIIIVESAKTADALINKLNALKDGTEAFDGETEKETVFSDSDSLYRFTSKKKMLYTLISILSTVFFTAVFSIFLITVIGACKLMLELDVLGTWGQYFLYGLLITVFAMLILSLVSFVGCMINSFVGYYNFSVTKCAGNIQISFGLLEKHTNTFSYDRIKAVKITQGLVQRLLGFASIKLEVIGYTNEAGENNVELGVLVPFCKYDETDEILAKILPDYVPVKKQTDAVAYFPFISWFLLVFSLITGTALALTVAVMAIFNAPAFAICTVCIATLIVSAVIIVIKCADSALSFKNNGVAESENKITVYSGGFTKTATVFPAKNLIAVESVTTPLREKYGIISLVMHLKTNAFSNEVKVRIQKQALSERFEKMLTM